MLFTALLLLSYLLALTFTYGLISYLSKDLLDVPNSRSSHKKPILRGGGLSFIVAFLITGAILSRENGWVSQVYFTPLLEALHNCDQDSVFKSIFCSSSTSTSLWQITLALFPLVITSFIDDLRNLSVSTRSLIQIIVAILIVTFFGTVPLPGIESLGTSGVIIAAVFTTIAIVAIINFYNFMDGLDGLVASVTALQLSFLAFYLQQPLFLLLVTALAGFIYWNWSPAKIFMGDVGSTFLGAIVAIALLSAHQSPTIAWSAFTVILPLMGDSIYTLFRRLQRQENIFQPMDTFVYQRLQKSGFSHRQVAITYSLLTIIAAFIIESFGVWSILFNLLLTVISIVLAELYLSTQLQRR